MCFRFVWVLGVCLVLVASFCCGFAFCGLYCLTWVVPMVFVCVLSFRLIGWCGL